MVSRGASLLARKSSEHISSYVTAGRAIILSFLRELLVKALAVIHKPITTQDDGNNASVGGTTARTVGANARARTSTARPVHLWAVGQL